MSGKQSLAMRALGHSPELPDGWFEMFSWERIVHWASVRSDGEGLRIEG
jgi:hypothetical protein